jgi:hypothetical protein
MMLRFEEVFYLDQKIKIISSKYNAFTLIGNMMSKSDSSLCLYSAVEIFELEEGGGLSCNQAQ